MKLFSKICLHFLVSILLLHIPGPVLSASENSPSNLDEVLDRALVNKPAPENSPTENVTSNQSEQPPATQPANPPSHKTDLSSLVIPPNDPCLPGLYYDWQEVSQTEPQKKRGFAHYRIIINRTNFMLSLEGIGRNGYSQELYSSYVGLGDVNTPTPEGRFVINHIYCYPDVLYFDPSSEKIPGLYNGFFAPLLVCDAKGRCARHRDLGIHGYNKGGFDRRTRVSQTYGNISAGCIRVPDPCKLKSEIIKHVGIGPIKQNERGTYHWLSRPVEVIISDSYPDTTDDVTLASMFQQSLEQVQGGIRDILNLFGN